MLVLKPCCLPDWKAARAKTEWTVGGHTTRAADVAVRGKFSHGQWDGVKRSVLLPKFRLWVQHLLSSIEFDGEGRKQLVDLQLWNTQHIQTSYIVTVKPDWASLLGDAWAAWTEHVPSQVPSAPLMRPLDPVDVA